MVIKMGIVAGDVVTLSPVTIMAIITQATEIMVSVHDASVLFFKLHPVFYLLLLLVFSYSAFDNVLIALTNLN